MSRAGRPRKPGPRKPSGDRRFVPDPGTPELRAQRVRALSPYTAVEIDTQITTGQITPEEGIAKLAAHIMASDRRGSYTLGTLFARGLVDRQQHYAGNRYHGLFVRAVRGVGIPSVLGALLGGRRGPANGPELEPSAAMAGEFAKQVANPAAVTRQAYLDARAALETAGRRVPMAVDHVVIYDEPTSSAVVFHLMCRGLNALWRHFEARGATVVMVDTGHGGAAEEPDLEPLCGDQFRRAVWK